MSEVRIVAEPRTQFGKGHARRVRKANKVPAVLYGHGDEPRHLSLPGHELMLALKHDANVLLTLQTEDGEQLALPKVVVRDPIRGHLEHVDLVAVRKGERVTVEIQISVLGDAAPGTIVDQQVTTLTVSAEATHLPDHVELSIEGLTAGTALRASDVELPEGTELVQDAEGVIIQILAAPTDAEVEAELDAAAAELAPDEPEAEGDSPETEGSESDKAGDGDGDAVAESDS